MAINNDVYYESLYNFFDINNAAKHASFFQEFINSGEVSEYIKNLENDYGFKIQAIPIKAATLNALTDRNLNIESSIRFKANENGGNFVIGLLPDLRKLGLDENNHFSREVFNRNNKHKLYKVFGMNGSSRYSVFTATVAIDPNWNSSMGEYPRFVIQYINNTKTSFLMNELKDSKGVDNIIRVNPLNAKVSPKVLVRNSKGYSEYMNADYNEILKNTFGFNLSTVDGSGIYRDEKALNEITSILDNTNEPISLINFINSYSRRGGLGVMQDSYRNSSMRYGYLSGTELADMLNVNSNNIDLINKDYTYRLTFSTLKDDARISEIVPIDPSGKVVTEFSEGVGFQKHVVHGFNNTESYKFITKYENKQYFNRNRAMYKIAHLDSKLSQYLKGDDVRKYNSQIIDLFENKQMTREKSYEIANQLVNEYRQRLLDAYGFSSREDFDTSDYSKSFLNIYSKLDGPEGVPQQMENLRIALFDNFDVGMIAGNIYEGKLFDNLLTLNTQNQSIENKKYAISKAFQYILGYENSDTQRKAQSINGLPGFKLRDGDKIYNVNEIISEMFSNVREMEYKKTKFMNQQANDILDKFGRTMGYAGDQRPDINTNNFVRALYTYAGDFAFQESNVYSTTALMQSISMYDSKKDFVVPFNIINREVFEDMDDDAIKNFYRSLQNANYDVGKLSNDEQFIFYGKFMKNLLGEENYTKFHNGVYDASTIIEDLRSIETDLKKIGSIEANTKQAILSIDSASQKFNNWLNKHFIMANNLSEASILNQEMINNNFSGVIKGANFFGFDGFEVTPQGIKFKLKYGMIASQGSKMMNDNIKATVGATSHLLSIDYNNARIFIDTIINEKPTSTKRNFTGTEIARTLRTAAMNAINSEYDGYSNLSKAEKFKMFKKAMGAGLPVKEGLTRRKKFNNIFNVLNIDMEYDEASDSIVFVDNNIKGALKYFNTLDETAYESIDARIIENVMKHRKELFGKEFVVEEGKVLSGFIDSLISHNYEKLFSSMTNESQKNAIIFLRDDAQYSLSKSYINGDEVGMFNIGHFSGGKILHVSQSMMYETKSRKDLFGLKLGRLSALTLTELGMNNMVELLKAKSTSEENISTIIDYFALAAKRGTEYDRGSSTGYFYKVFKDNGNVINLNDLDDMPYSSFNHKGTTFLANSPFGKLLKYDYKEDRLVKSAKGLITGFSKTYMSNLKSFFDEDSVDSMLNVIGGSSKYAVLENEFEEAISVFNKMDVNSFVELQSKKEIYKDLDSKKVLSYIESIKGKLEDIISNDADTTLKESMKSFRELILRANNNPDANINLNNEFSNYRTLIRNSLLSNEALNLDEKRALSFVFDVMGKRENFSEKGFNIYKTMMSISNMYQTSAFGDYKDVFFGIENEQLKLKLMDKLYDFTLDKGMQHKFYKKYLNFNYGNKDLSRRLKNGIEINPINILKSFFYNFNSIEKENIYGIMDLQQISKYGNIGFIIDSFNIDKNGDMVPNTDIAAYERVVNSNNSIRRLERERASLYRFIDNYKTTSNNEVSNILQEEFDFFMKKHGSKYDQEKVYDVYKKVAGVYSSPFFYRNKSKQIPDELLKSLLFNESYLDKYESTPIRIVTDEISRKMLLFNNQITKNKIENANIISASDYQRLKIKHLKDINIDTMDISNIPLTNEQYNIIKNSIKNGRFSIKDFYSQITEGYGIYSKSPDDENIYKSVVELDEFVKGMFVDVYRKSLNKGAKAFKSDYKKLHGQTPVSLGDINKMMKNILALNGDSNYSALYAYTIGEILNNEDVLERYDENIVEKIVRLTSSLMTREQARAARLYSKGGGLYDITSVLVPDSAAFSPSEASGITSIIKSEAENIFKNRKFDDNGNIIKSAELDDFKKALKLIYGESIVDEHIRRFDELYSNKDVDINLLRKSLNEIKGKLDMYSGIVIGTKEDWNRMNKSHWFKNSNVYTGYLSRHPHQYKFSISSNRFIQIDDATRSLSFLGKYFGSENKLNSSQSSLMFVGKMTAMLANGDFDGDTFQIMSLGERSLDIKDLRSMTSYQFMNTLQKKSKLFYLLRNVAGEDLRDVFENEMYNWSLYDEYQSLVNKKNLNAKQSTRLDLLRDEYENMDGKKYAEIRNRIIDTYTVKKNGKYYFGDYRTKKINGVLHYFDDSTKKWQILSSNKIYERIEDDFLSISNEFFRVSKKLKKEINAHKALHGISGFYEAEIIDGKKVQVSKKTLLTFLATLTGEHRDKFVRGELTKGDLADAITNNNVIYGAMKKELRNALKLDNGVSLLTMITRDVEADNRLTAVRTVSNELNTFLQNVGQAKSGEVHDKLTKYRSMINTLLQKGAMEEVQAYLDDLGVVYDKDIYNAANLRGFNLGHNIGTLVEDLSISAKKGNGISPDRFIEGFNRGETLIKNSQLNFDIVKMDKLIRELQQENNREFNILKNANPSVDILDLIADENKPINGKIAKSLGEQTIYDFFKNMFKNQNVEALSNTKQAENSFRELAKTYLNLFTELTESEIDEFLTNNNIKKVKMSEIFGSNYGNQGFIKDLSVWGHIMYKGTVERDTGITEFDTAPVFKQIFKKGTYNFLKRTSEFLKFIGAKGLGTRLEGKYLSWLNHSKIHELLEKQRNKNGTTEEIAEEVNQIADEINTKAETKFKASESSVEEAANTVDNENIKVNNVEETISETPEQKINKVAEEAADVVEDASDETSDSSSSIIKKLQRIIDERDEQIKKLNKQIEKLKDSSDEELINSLKANLESISKENKRMKDELSVLYQQGPKKNNIVDEATNVSSVKSNVTATISDYANTAKKFIGEHKKMTAAALGTVVLAGFFRIFQSNRPVVNLDINEQEYERSQGSVYRNLGQYTMNTNIRSLY